MTKHVFDRPKTVSGAMMLRAARIERKKRPSRATLILQRRSRHRDWAQRAKFYRQFARDADL
ncbi:hypothetical protein BC777_3578 [Yoonia maricola]|uniref:Uncharacterized protein n=1 Tax=Yoonia maricola TaxID=420999 RepID=A0A2M8W0S9_9RHOB|nr:hypothetical protein [Yoonia maricola]PJI84517.1 hypothetical protein BC777_3578 [Yoonia maricola]